MKTVVAIAYLAASAQGFGSFFGAEPASKEISTACATDFAMGGTWKDFLECSMTKEVSPDVCPAKPKDEYLIDDPECKPAGSYGTYLKIGFMGDPTCQATSWCIPDTFCNTKNEDSAVCNQNGICPSVGLFAPGGFAVQPEGYGCISEINEYSLQDCEQAFKQNACLGTEMAIPRTCVHPDKPGTPRFFLPMATVEGGYFFPDVEACKAMEPTFMAAGYEGKTWLDPATNKTSADFWADSTPGKCDKEKYEDALANYGSMWDESDLAGTPWRTGVNKATEESGFIKEEVISRMANSSYVVRCCTYEGDMADPNNPPVCKMARRLQMEAHARGEALHLKASDVAAAMLG